jgi:hypothetical protein
MQASPLEQIKSRFGDSKEENLTEARKAAKEAIVKEIRDLVKKGDLLEDDFSDKGIERVSNKKLLKLLEVAHTVETDFGSRSALIDKIVELEGREKDAGYREHLEGYRLPALYDYYLGSKKRA